MGVRDDLLVGPSYGAGVIGAPICWSKSLARPLGDVERNPAGTGGDAGTRRVTIEHPGASGAGKWKWFSQMRVPPAGGPPPPLRAWRPATRAGPARDLPDAAGRDASRIEGSVVRPPASLYLARPGSCAGQLERPSNGDLGREHGRSCHRRHRLALGSRLPGRRGPNLPRPRRTLLQSPRAGLRGEGPRSVPPLTSPLRLRSAGRAPPSQALRAGLRSCPALRSESYKRAAGSRGVMRNSFNVQICTFS